MPGATVQVTRVPNQVNAGASDTLYVRSWFALAGARLKLDFEPGASSRESSQATDIRAELNRADMESVPSGVRNAEASTFFTTCIRLTCI